MALTLFEQAYVQSQLDVLNKVYKVKQIVAVKVIKHNVEFTARIPLVPPRGNKKHQDRNFTCKFKSVESASAFVKVLQKNFKCPTS